MKKTFIVTTLILCLVVFQTTAFGETKDDKTQTVTDEQISFACTAATATAVAATAVVNPAAGAVATIVAVPVEKGCEKALKNLRDKKKKTKDD